MTYRIKGTLKLPDGSAAAGVDIEFISRRNYSPLLMDLSSIIKTTSTGAYDITLQYGEYAVVVYWGCNQPSHIGKLFVFSDTVPDLDLQTLLQQADWQPATPEYIQQIQDWLTQAGASASQAVNSAAAAKASELASEADRAEVSSNKTIVVNAQVDVTAKHSDVTTKAAQVATNTATVNEKTPLAVAAADTASQKAASAAESDASARDAATRAENAALAMTGAILDGGECDLSSGFYPQPLTVNGQKYSTVWYVKIGGTVGGVTYDAGDKLQYTTANNGFYFRIDARDEVVSVNGEKGAVTLTAEKVGADPAGTASAVMQQHVSAPDPHSQYALKSSLGTAASRNIGSGEGQLLYQGCDISANDWAGGKGFGVAENFIGDTYYTWIRLQRRVESAPAKGLGGNIGIAYDGRNGGELAYSPFTWVDSEQVYFVRTTKNTTIDSNGFIKNASPITRLYGNETSAKLDSEYLAYGCAAVNNEAEGVYAVREAVGSYRVTGSLGFAKDGWYIETPADANGNKLLFVEYEQCDNGDILIKTFSPDYSTGRCMAGEPKDIPSGRWIDLRLSMPSKA